jgi:hypothetical protein
MSGWDSWAAGRGLARSGNGLESEPHMALGESAIGFPLGPIWLLTWVG